MNQIDRPILVMVPGIGDDQSSVYQQFAAVWRRIGYETHIVSFGWVDTTSPLGPKNQAFWSRLDQLSGGGRPLYIIGISAGGTAAVNALVARPNIVQKVITVCAPLDHLPNLHNPLLAESIELVRANLEALTREQKQRILSVRALYDQVVRPSLSRPADIATRRIWMIAHAPTIFVALTLGAHRLNRFFRKGM